MAVLKYKDPATGETKKLGIPSDDIAKEHVGRTDNPHNVTAEQIGAATKSIVVNTDLLAASWSDASYYTLSISEITTTTNQEILPAVNITPEQLEALQSANLQDGGQTNGSVTLKAFGDVPTIDIPIRVIVRGDM